VVSAEAFVASACPLAFLEQGIKVHGQSIVPLEMKLITNQCVQRVI